MLWIALHLPQLPLDAVLRCRSSRAAGEEAAADAPEVPGLPLAIGENRRIGWCNAAAEEAGILPGMSEANARALDARLQILARDLQAETQALQELALTALRFTPQVVLRPAGLLLEVSASLRLFNGAPSIASQLLSGAKALGVQARLAGAATATGAWLRAQCDELPRIFEQDAAQALDALPVSVLDAAQAHLATLEDIGCRTVGALRKLPRGGITRRFGGALLGELDRAYGEEAEVCAWFVPPAQFDARLELPARVEGTEALLFAAHRLLLQLIGWLTARHAAILGFTLGLHHESGRHRDHRCTPLTIVLGMPSRDIDHLTLLLRERLGQLDVPAPTIELTLKAEQIVALAAPNTELFPTPVSRAESGGRLIERLQSRLGTFAVRHLAIVADHRPERSIAMPPVAGTGRRATGEAESGNAVRPTWLLPQPVALATQRDKPFYHGALTLLSGPERIEAGWWDDALATRDYFVAQNDRHQLLWIYRLRTLQEDGGSGWFLHGFFG